MTLPHQYTDSTTQEEVDAEVIENGFISGMLNRDGSVTFTMQRMKHKELLKEIEKKIDTSLDKMVGSDDLPDVSKITVNGIYTDYTITTKNIAPSPAEIASVLDFYSITCKYALYSGESIRNIHIDFINEKTERIIDSYDSNDKGKHIKYAGTNETEKTEEEIFKNLNILDKINVENGLYDVKMTLPPEFVSVSTQDEADKKAKENGYESAILNSDGSATCTLSKITYKRTLKRIEKEIDNALNSMIKSKDFPDITKITVNGIYTNYVITTTNNGISSADLYSALSYFTYSCMYAAYSGENVENIHIDFVNEKSGKTIDSFDSSTAGKQAHFYKGNNNDSITEILNLLGQTNVKKGFFYVTMTLPSKFIKITTQKDANSLAEKKGYSSAKLNKDGSVTLVMSKAKHDELLAVVENGIDTALNDMVKSEWLPDITKIIVNGNYTQYTITTTNDECSLADSLSVLAYLTNSCTYAVFSGEKINNIHIDFVNEKTGKIIDSYDTNKLRHN